MLSCKFYLLIVHIHTCMVVLAQLYPYRALPIHLSSVKQVPKISELVIVITLFELINAFWANKHHVVLQCSD